MVHIDGIHNVYAIKGTGTKNRYVDFYGRLSISTSLSTLYGTACTVLYGVCILYGTACTVLYGVCILYGTAVSYTILPLHNNSISEYTVM